MIIAIDGPAGAGKGTISQYLAKHYGLEHLDSGLLYRAAALRIHQKNVISLEEKINIIKEISWNDLANLPLKTEEVGSLASQMAVIPQIREVITNFIRTIAENSPGIVIDGRDIGSVVYPNATVKLYITASPKVRAERRLKEENKKGELETYQNLIQERDKRDQKRDASPLEVAPGAHVIDTTNLTLEESFKKAISFVEITLKYLQSADTPDASNTSDTLEC